MGTTFPKKTATKATVTIVERAERNMSTQSFLPEVMRGIGVSMRHFFFNIKDMVKNERPDPVTERLDERRLALVVGDHTVRKVDVALRERTKRQREATETILAFQALANEAEVRRRLRTSFDITLPRFDLLAQLDRTPQGMTPIGHPPGAPAPRRVMAQS